MTRMRLVIPMLLVGLICLHCSKSAEPPEVTPNPPSPPADLTAVKKQLVSSSNKFGLNLFAELTGQAEPGKNVFISPLSVSYALAMTYNGAVGETEKAMAEVLGFEGLSLEAMNQSFHELTEYLTTLDSFTLFELANSIWYRQDVSVRDTFITLNQTWFDAAVMAMNFQASDAADIINQWVAAATHDKITKIINPPIDPAVALLLINAIYFKGAWTHPFDTAHTFNSQFQAGDGSTLDCRMMTKDTVFNYFENDQFQAVDLPYGKKDYSMTILLPRPEVDIDQLIAQLTPETWAAWMGQFAETEMIFGMPKLKLEYNTSLKSMLIALGMGQAFTDRADFSNMVKDGGVCIGDVLHKTFLQVDEKGTEAAAVTVVIIIETSLPPMMICNRPYLMVIREKETGTILFIGRISAPEWKN